MRLGKLTQQASRELDNSQRKFWTQFLQLLILRKAVIETSVPPDSQPPFTKMWAWCHVTPSLQTRIHWPPAKSLSRSSRRGCLPACSPQEVFPKTELLALTLLDVFQSTRTSPRRPPQVSLLLSLSFSSISHLQSRRVILWSTESSEDLLLFIFPATSYDVGTEEALCVTKMEEHTQFLNRGREGFDGLPSREGLKWTPKSASWPCMVVFI